MNERIIGRCIQVGDDETGNPRLIIETTREQLSKFTKNLLYANVEVTLSVPARPKGLMPRTICAVCGKSVCTANKGKWVRNHRDAGGEWCSGGGIVASP